MNNKNFIALGNFRNYSIYYDIKAKQLKTSKHQEMKDYNTIAVASLSIITISILRFLNNIIRLEGHLISYPLLVVGTALVVLLNTYITKEQYKKLELTPFFLPSTECENYLQEQLKSARLLSVLELFLFVLIGSLLVIYLFHPSILILFLYLLFFLIAHLIFINNIHRRRKYIREMMEEVKKVNR